MPDSYRAATISARRWVLNATAGEQVGQRKTPG